MAARALKRTLYTLLAATGVGLVLVALFLLSRTAQNSDDFDRLHNVILSINIAGVLVLFVFLVGNLSRLLRDYRTHVPGEYDVVFVGATGVGAGRNRTSRLF